LFTLQASKYFAKNNIIHILVREDILGSLGEGGVQALGSIVPEGDPEEPGTVARRLRTILWKTGSDRVKEQMGSVSWFRATICYQEGQLKGNPSSHNRSYLCPRIEVNQDGPRGRVCVDLKIDLLKHRVVFF
jgi:hypothetical protein